MAGSLIGVQHGISSDVEVINMQAINEAYERMLKSDVKCRFVIDMKTLEQGTVTDRLP